MDAARTYRPRLADRILDDALGASGAVMGTGPRTGGKTTTAARHLGLTPSARRVTRRWQGMVGMDNSGENAVARDDIPGWTAAPVMVAAGMLGVVSTLLVGAFAAVATVSVLG